MKVSLITLGLVSLCCTYTTEGSKMEVQLIKYLMNGYEISARPVEEFSDVVNVTMDVALNQIFDLDEKNQILKSLIWLRLNWIDYGLQWNSSKYEGLKDITLASTRVWRPDLTLWNNAADTFALGQDTQVKIKSDGSVTWNTPATIESTCAVDVKYFPFDEQACILKFGSWSLHGLQLDLFSKNDTGDTASFVGNGEWELVKFPVKKNVVFYTCCPEPYHDLSYEIVIRRRSLYYVFNLVFPVILITMITMLAFYLPSESGEKVALGVTVLLAMTVFLLIIAENMPPTSAAVPLIGQFFGATIVMLGLSTAMTVIVLHIHFKGSDEKRVPRWLHNFVLVFLAKAMCMYHSEDKCAEENTPLTGFALTYNTPEKFRIETIKYTSQQGSNNHSISKTTDDMTVNYEMLLRLSSLEQAITTRLYEDEKQQSLDNEWRKVARVIDRLFLVLFLTFTLITWLIILLNRPSSTF